MSGDVKQDLGFYYHEDSHDEAGFQNLTFFITKKIFDSFLCSVFLSGGTGFFDFETSARVTQ